MIQPLEPNRLSSERRFRVALSFSGPERVFVSEVAHHLSQHFGAGVIFYDAYFRAELARVDLDTYLQDIYHNDSDLVVLFFSDTYKDNTWCGLEWRAIRNLIHQRPSSVVLVRMSSSRLPDGIFPTDGYIPGDTLTPQEVAGDIISRYTHDFGAGNSRPAELTEQLADRDGKESSLVESLISLTMSAAYLLYVSRDRVATLFQQVDAETLATMAIRQRRFLPFGEPGANTGDDRTRKALVGQLVAVLEHLSKTAAIGNLETCVKEKQPLSFDWYRVKGGFRADPWNPANPAINLRASVEDWELVLSCSKRNVAGVIDEGGTLIPTSTSAVLFDADFSLPLSGLVRLSAADRENRKLRGSALFLILEPLGEQL